MGIPRFYRWLKERYPLIRMDLTDPERQRPLFDNLYIDFNALVYQCIRERDCFLKNKINPLTLQEIQQRVLEYLLRLVQAVNPSQLLFIAFDGVAPRAKINQSRDRRFRSGVEDIEFFENLVESIGIEDKEQFQANSISPGTEFLFSLCQFLKGKIMELMEGEWKGLQVLYSDCCVPGQGEHKIMDFLRYSKQIDLFHPTTTHCVYSPDADVILLTLALDIQYVAIIKEDTTQKPSMNWTATCTTRKLPSPQFELVFINILKEYLASEFKEELVVVEGSCIQDIIDDFVLLMAFIGNDFLPVEFCFKLTDTHMDALFNHYRDYLRENKQFINRRGIIDWQKVTALLRVAKKFEAQRISELKVRFKSRKQSREQESVFDERREAEVQNSQIDKFQVEDDKIVKGTAEYYESRFNIQKKESSIHFVSIIKKYIEGLEFYCQYYYRGLPSWNWFYPFHYTPLLSDVYDYLTKHPVKVQLQKAQPFQPILALLFMFPEQNFGLLPKPVAAALTDPASILRQPTDYFPKKFQLDKFDDLNYSKRAMIQFLKEDDVRKVYNSIPQESLSKEEQARNQKNNTLLFYPNKGHFSGMEVVFSEQFQNELKTILSSKGKASIQQRFPTLSIYNGESLLNDKGKVASRQKYQYNGSPTELVFFNNFLGYVERQETPTLAQRSEIEMDYEKKASISGTCQHFYVVKRGRYVRELQRNHVARTRREVIVPDFALFKAPNYDYLPKTSTFECKELYQLKENVVVLTEQFFGCTGTVEQLGDKTLKVRLLTDPIKGEQSIEELEDQFFSLNNVLKELEISRESLFSIISEVILLPVVKKKQWNERLPTSFNFGLNFIDIPNAKIVPRFVRCNFQHEDTRVPQKMFDDLEFSRLALSLLQKYLQVFPWLVELLEEWRSPKLRKEFKAGNCFGREKDPNLRLYKEFIKLYEFDTQGTFCSFYSKTADLQRLPKMYTEKKGSNATITLQYFEVTSRSLGMKAPPALRAEPEYHDIGSRVILLNSLQVGYVVCIDDQWIHVAVGKAKRIFKIRFTALFNEKWSSFLSREMGVGWNLEVGFYTPTFWKQVTQVRQVT